MPSKVKYNRIRIFEFFVICLLLFYLIINYTRKAFKYLIETVIPRFAPTFDRLVTVAFVRKTVEPGSFTFNIGRLLHQNGINIRYLGVLRRCVKSVKAKGIILIEMVARIMKRHIRLQMRKRMEQLRFPLGTLFHSPLFLMFLYYLSL